MYFSSLYIILCFKYLLLKLKPNSTKNYAYLKNKLTTNLEKNIHILLDF